MQTVLLVFDIGTSGLKASLVDEGLNILRNVTTTYPTHYLPNGGVEQDAADWWMSAVRAMLSSCRNTSNGSTQSAFPAICWAFCRWTMMGRRFARQ